MKRAERLAVVLAACIAFAVGWLTVPLVDPSVGRRKPRFVGTTRGGLNVYRCDDGRSVSTHVVRGNE